jgi:hypothetical protein
MTNKIEGSDQETSPVDGQVPCARRNRAPEFQGPPISCCAIVLEVNFISFDMFRHVAQAQHAMVS